MTAVSVVVPLYNKEPFVGRCLESLRDQTLADIEVIVVDDGSTDGGRAVVEGIIGKDSRFSLIRQANSGPSAARNAGLGAATGVFVGFVDADDLVEATMFEQMLAAAASGDHAGARCRFLRFDGDVGHADDAPIGTPGGAAKRGAVDSVRGGELYVRLFTGPDVSLMSACTGIYRRSVLASAHLRFDEQLHHTEDLLFNAEFYSLDMPVAVVDAPLYHYRSIDRSLGRSYDADLHISIDRLYGELVRLEASPDATQRMVTANGHPALMRYLGLYYALALAQEAAAPDHAAPFAQRVERLLANSRMNEVLAKAESEQALATPVRLMWRLAMNRRHGLLRALLGVFNIARSARRSLMSSGT